MENFLQKLKQTSNPVSGSAVSPQASALINMLKGSVKTGNVNQDIYNPQGYTGTNGYNGDYAALLSDQIKNALGNTGLYDQVTGSSYDQMSAQNNASDSIYNNRKAETGGLAQKEYQNQMSGYGVNPLNVIGQKTLSSIDNSVKMIQDMPQYKSANDWNSAVTKMVYPLSELRDSGAGDDDVLSPAQANQFIEAFGQAAQGGILGQNVYDANGNVSKNVKTDMEKYIGYALPNGLSKSNMTVRAAKAFYNAAKANRAQFASQVKDSYDKSLGNSSPNANLVNTSSKGQLTIDQIPSVSSLKGAMSGFIK